MSFLNFLTGTAGYTAILAAFGLAVAAHFFAPRAWSALAWTIAFGVLGAAFVGQREITASVRVEAAEQATKRAEEARAVAEATDKLRTAVHAWRDAQTAFLSTLDARITKEVSDALAENNRRRHAVAAGTVRVRYVAARCPSPDLPAASATGGVGDGAGIELAPAAGLDVLDLREALIRDRAKIEYLQGYIRKITEPVPPLGLKAPADYELRGTPAGETRARLSPTK
mgnify:CR=1 FL=1